MTGTSEWVVERWEGSGGLLHGRDMPVDGRRRVSLLQVTRPTVVMGSTSPVVADRPWWNGARVDVCRRRSGGGLVWLEPGNSTWVDVCVPAGDPLAERDVGRAFLWLGDAFVDAARQVGIEARAHRGGHRPGPDRGLICFEGVGAGEVLVGDQKLVGISQRRTRSGSRFQCVWYRSWQLGALASVVGPAVALRAAAAGVGVAELEPQVDTADLLDAVVAAIRAR